MIRSCPPDDLVARVFKDRYRSIYQVDYCKQGEWSEKRLWRRA